MDSAADLARKAEMLFESGDDLELLTLVQTHWPGDVDGRIPEGMAESCRLARLASCRLMETVTQEDPRMRDYYINRNLWEAHGLTAAALSGERHVVAGFLLPRFFRLIEKAAYREARAVVDDMMRLVDDSADHQPFARVLRRLCHEKKGFSYFAEGRYQEASACYADALTFTQAGSRGHLKVRAGLALARHLASSNPDETVEPLRAELRAIQMAAAGAPYPDVDRWAKANLQILEAGLPATFVAFELI